MRRSKNHSRHKHPAKPAHRIGGFHRPEAEPGMPFVQSSSTTDGPISPQDLFGFFTYEIMLEKKVFVR